MRPEPPEHHRTENKRDRRDSPEVEGHFPMYPEPGLADKAVPIPLHQVVNRVELQIDVILLWYDLRIPEDGRQEKPELQEYGDDLAQILEENDHGRGQPGKTEDQDERAEKIIDNLQPINVRGVAVNKVHDKNEGNEKEMNEKGGEYLDDGEDADAEDHLLDDEGVMRHGVHAVVHAVVEKVPDDHPGNVPENIGEILYRLGFEADLKDEPEDEYIGKRQYEGPDDAEIGAEVDGLEVPFGQFIDDVPAGKEFRHKIEKHPDTLHVPPVNSEWRIELCMVSQFPRQNNGFLRDMASLSTVRHLQPFHKEMLNPS